MRYVWDQYDTYFDADSALIPRLGMRLCRRYLQAWDLRSARRVDHFVANSDNVAGKVRKLYGRDATTIYPPVDLERFSADGTPASYYLVVSALVPYKRIDLAIDAFNEMGLPLKVVGDGPLRAKLQTRAGAKIEFLGLVDDRALAQLYASCRALVFPGEEDFGIVAVEAQASGRPVIAYGKGGVIESVHGLDAASESVTGFSHCPTGIFFREPTAASLMDALRRFEQNEKAFDAGAIRVHAAKFSRGQFKQRIADFIAEKLMQRNC
jgi:glycosyltransferase involved in cell wall biosynthesis